ncbi:MAG: glycosyltransferase [Phycisphaerales bacterium]
MPSRLLLLLPQLPHDPTSGAARSMLGIARTLAAAGYQVRALSPTATESAHPLNPLLVLNKSRLRVEVDRRPAVGRGRPVLRFEDGGVACAALDTGTLGLRDWDVAHGAQFNRLLEDELTRTAPEIVLTFGGSPPDLLRRELCRLAGAAVVFGLRNLAYLHPLAFEHVDSVLSVSAFIQRTYRESIGLESTAIPPVIDPAEIVPEHHEPRYFTFVNPTPAKGVFFMLRLLDELAARRPDIPLRVVEGRASAAHFAKAANMCGLDLRFMKNLTLSPTFASPREVFAKTKAVLMPSAEPEPFGRVAAEALACGVPPLVGDRGGLPEAAAGGGVVLPLPASFTKDSRTAPLAADVQPWIDAIVRLHDDPRAYAEACARARSAAGTFAPGAIGPRLVEYFDGVRRGGRPLRQEAATGSRSP